MLFERYASFASSYSSETIEIMGEKLLEIPIMHNIILSLVLRDFFFFFFAKNSTHVVLEPSHSPDLASRNFWLFNKLSRSLRGCHFDTIEDIKLESKKVLKAIPEKVYSECFEDSKRRWQSRRGLL